MYDIVVIGAGPAGLSAAITARARNKEVLVVSNKPQQSPLAAARVIGNYAGVPQISGLALLKQMLAHARSLGVMFVFERVISVLPTDGHFMVITSDMSAEAASVILATGTQQAAPFDGERELLGRGVSYCATCDGMLFRSQTVCVVGMSDEAIDEANFLTEIGAQVVFLTKKTPAGLDGGILVKEGNLIAIEGDGTSVSGVRFKERTSGETELIPCGGVFILRPAIAPDALLAGLEVAEGSIVVDEAMRTGIEGVFAAGDCVGQPLQISKAAGEGQVACLSAVQYLRG
jgi:thioredoxin reductase (NADPH)